MMAAPAPAVQQPAQPQAAADPFGGGGAPLVPSKSAGLFAGMSAGAPPAPNGGHGVGPGGEFTVTFRQQKLGLNLQGQNMKVPLTTSFAWTTNNPLTPTTTGHPPPTPASACLQVAVCFMHLPNR